MLINQKGDTIVQFNIEDARFVLGRLLDAEIADSIIIGYITKDKLNQSTISLQLEKIKALQLKSENYEEQIKNLELILANKDTETQILNNTIREKDKEIIKQTNLKKLGFIAAIVLPILVLLI